MSLARSASGPAGGLSINTSAANAFGSTASAQPAASGGLFGSAKPASANPATTTGGMATAGGLFGNNAAAGAQKTGTGLFGSSTTGTTPAATTGTGLFGNAAANTTGTTQPASGGLFGNTNNAAGATTNTQQQAGGGLFGQKPATGGGLFGANTATTPAAATGTIGGGLFGQSTAQSQQQQPAQIGGGLFGAPANNATAATGGGLFGQTQNQQSTPALGTSTNQVPAVQINVDSIRPRTRFDDLAKPVQDEIALLDKGIQRVIKMRDEIGEFMPQHERDIEQLGRDVTFVESKFRTVQVALNNDIQTVKALQDLTKKNAADARLAFRGADNLKLPVHYHQTGLFASQAPAPGDSSAGDAASSHADAQDLITYFNRVCDDIDRYKKRLDEYRGEIERDMPGVENGLYEQIRAVRDRVAGNAIVQDQLGEVLAALRDTGNAIVAQAGQIADTRERLSRLQAGIVDTGMFMAA